MIRGALNDVFDVFMSLTSDLCGVDTEDTPSHRIPVNKPYYWLTVWAGTSTRKLKVIEQFSYEKEFTRSNYKVVYMHVGIK